MLSEVSDRALEPGRLCRLDKSYVRKVLFLACRAINRINYEVGVNNSAVRVWADAPFRGFWYIAAAELGASERRSCYSTRRSSFFLLPEEAAVHCFHRLQLQAWSVEWVVVISLISKSVAKSVVRSSCSILCNTEDKGGGTRGESEDVQIDEACRWKSRSLLLSP